MNSASALILIALCIGTSTAMPANNPDLWKEMAQEMEYINSGVGTIAEHIYKTIAHSKMEVKQPIHDIIPAFLKQAEDLMGNLTEKIFLKNLVQSEVNNYAGQLERIFDDAREQLEEPLSHVDPEHVGYVKAHFLEGRGRITRHFSNIRAQLSKIVA